MQIQEELKKIHLGDYKYLYNLKYLFINRANKEVYLINKDNQKRKIYTNSYFFSKPFKLTKETFESLIDIMIKNKIK